MGGLGQFLKCPGHIRVVGSWLRHDKSQSRAEELAMSNKRVE